MCTPPSNLTVTDITSHSASLGWSSYEDAGWYIYHSTSSTPPTLSTTPTIDYTRTEPEKLENLQPSTTYYAWVRTSCSDWSEGVSFTTTNCNPINVTANGWTEDFEGFPTHEVPDCWDNSMSTSSSSPYYLWGICHADDNKMLYMCNEYVGAGTAVINSRSITLPSTGTYNLSFKYSHRAS